MKRIGLFGGSFNPIHLGHTALAAYICEQGLVDEVWLLVSPQNPLKQDLTLLDENERLHMARLAVAPYPMLKACDFEFSLPRPSYTYHTLQALRKAYPDHEFSLIIGEDNWQCFGRWYRGEDIARETPIIVYPREVEGLGLRVEGKLRDVYPTGWYYFPQNSEEETPSTLNPQPSTPKLLPYSSTEVRHHIAAGQETSHMLHPDVAQYIREKHFYQG
jgi:nicotinate-nucleotide adenylyltransferase